MPYTGRPALLSEGGIQESFVLPIQFYELTQRSRANSGAARLMFAVFMDAIHCLNKPRSGKRSHRLAKETLDWVNAEEETRLFSFVSCCIYLKFSIPETRRLMQNLYDRQPSVYTGRLGDV